MYADFDNDDGGAWHHHEEQLRQVFGDSQYRRATFNSKETTMGFVAKDNGGGDRKFENAPAGAYVARCFRVIDLGTQTFQVKGETKQAWQCVITWELGKTMPDGKPYTINEKYTVSLNEKAKLNAILEGWRGRKFTDAERNGFEMKNLLGKVCFLNIVHSSRGDKTYANVASAMPVPEGMASPAPVNELVYYSLSDHDERVFEKLPKYYRETIQKSPEYQQLSFRGSSGSAPAAGADSDLDDDIPF